MRLESYLNTPSAIKWDMVSHLRLREVSQWIDLLISWSTERKKVYLDLLKILAVNWINHEQRSAIVKIFMNNDFYYRVNLKFILKNHSKFQDIFVVRCVWKKINNFFIIIVDNGIEYKYFLTPTSISIVWENQTVWEISPERFFSF